MEDKQKINAEQPEKPPVKSGEGQEIESEGSATAFEQTENVADDEGEFNNTLREK